MNAVRIAALALIIGGALGLAYGGFNYTSDTHNVDVGPLHVSIEEKERFSVPVWAGLAAVAIGGLLLFIRR